MQSTMTRPLGQDCGATRQDGSRKSTYNARKIRRCVRRQEVTRDGQVISVTKSFTNDEGKYHPTVDVNTGYVHCDCKDFEMRCGKHEPHVLSAPSHLCKHSIDAILGCVRRGELELPKEQVAALKRDRTRPAGFSKRESAPSVTRCSVCGQAGETFEMADDEGRPLSGERICRDCIEARMDDLSDAAPESFTMPTPDPRFTPDPNHAGRMLNGDVNYAALWDC